jgi:hypothetical protein
LEIVYRNTACVRSPDGGQNGEAIPLYGIVPENQGPLESCISQDS